MKRDRPDSLLTDVRVVLDPAGHDRELAAACQDVKAGHYGAARDLLAATGTCWDLRGLRSQLLAHAARDSGAAIHWAAAEPGSADAAMLAARCAVLDACAAVRAESGLAQQAVDRAGDACMAAADRWPEDPVPWTALLQLDRVAPRRAPGPAGLEGIQGPWDLMEQVWRRDQFNREAHHRLLAALAPQARGSVDAVFRVARWIVTKAPEGSPLFVLPLLAYIEAFKKAVHAAGAFGNRRFAAERQWATTAAQADMQRAFDAWFNSERRADTVVLADLHLLAHALWSSRYPDLCRRAVPVFEAIGSYGLTQPWKLNGEPLYAFERARRLCAHA